jgi:hypothetical protein
MIVTLDLTWAINLLPYLLLGIGIGIAFFYIFYDKNSMTELERKKHDLEVNKEWLRMLAEQKKETSKKQRWNNNVRRN